MLKKEKTWNLIGILLGLAILIVGIVFIKTPPAYSFYTDSVSDITFGGDYYTEQYNATRVAVNNIAVVARNLDKIGEAIANYFGCFFIVFGLLIILHYAKHYFTCVRTAGDFSENPQKAEPDIEYALPTGEEKAEN